MLQDISLVGQNPCFSGQCHSAGSLIRILALGGPVCCFCLTHTKITGQLWPNEGYGGNFLVSRNEEEAKEEGEGREGFFITSVQDFTILGGQICDNADKSSCLEKTSLNFN